MALTYLEKLALRDASLTHLLDRSRDLWLRKAKKAYEYTRGEVVPASDVVRPDDVIQVLEPSLEVALELRDYLAEKRLTQKYWYRRFGNLLLDTFWHELTRTSEAKP
jgi:hypothetical protein